MSIEELKSQNEELKSQIKKLNHKMNDLVDELEEKSDYEYLKDTLENKENKLKKLKEKNQKLKDKIEDINNKTKDKIKDINDKCIELKQENKNLKDEIKELQKEIKNNDKRVALKDSTISNLEDEILRYKERIAQYENGEMIKQLKEQLNVKGETIEDLRCMVQSNVKQNKSNNVSDVESKSIIRKQNKTIQHLQDELILKDKKIKNLETPIDKTEITGKRKVYNHMEEIKNYQDDYDRYFTSLNGQTNGKKYRLNITNYKKATDYKTNKERSMKYLEDLGIKKSETTQRYDMTKDQFDALIEKVILYRYNEGIYKI